MKYYKELYVYDGQDDWDEMKELNDWELTKFLDWVEKEYTLFGKKGFLALISREGAEETMRVTYALENKQTYEERFLKESGVFGIIFTVSKQFGIEDLFWDERKRDNDFDMMESMIDKYIEKKLSEV